MAPDTDPRGSQEATSANHVTAAQKAVRGLRRRCRFLLTARMSLLLCAAWIFAWGTAVLAWRVTSGGAALWLWTGLIGLPAALVCAFLLARRRTPAYSSLLALVERRSRGGGFLVTSRERDLGAWAKEAGPYQLPRLRVQWKRPAGGAALAVLFLGLAWLLPLPQASARQLLDIDRSLEELAQQIDVLEEEQIYREDEAQSLRQQMEEVKEQSDAEDPGRTYEALDHLEEQLEQSAQQAAEEAAKGIEQMAQAEELAQALAQAAGDIPSQLQSQGGAELQEMLSQMGGEFGQMSADAFDSDALQSLAGQLSLSKDGLLQSMERLQSMRLIDAETLGRCKNAGKNDPDALAAFLSENSSNILAENARCQLPGRGGVDRGRGDAWLTFGDEVGDEGFGFQETPLPPASLSSLEDTELVGMSSSAPHTDPGEASGGSTLGSAQAGGGSAVKRTVLPRHRGAVQRFFERTQGGGEPSQQPPR